MNTNVSANVTNLIVLTKESTENQIKTYFQRVLELKQSNDEFPINLDEVWMLVYSAKEKAVRALKKDFIEHEDFITLAQNGDGGRFAPIDYKLSVSCLEYFIARKVRPVFNVYRQVFHKVAEQKPLSQLEIIAQSAQILLEQDKRLSSVEQKVKEIEAKQITRPDCYAIAGYASLFNMPVTTEKAKQLGIKARAICKKRGLTITTTPDPRFGKVNIYPTVILEEVFNLYYN